MNEQEAFWSGSFGTSYIDRNSGRDLIEANKALFAEVFRHTGSVTSLIEFGANIGLNLEAIHELDPKIHLEAVEINFDAACQLASKRICDVHVGSMLRYVPQAKRQMALAKGILIHISEEHLPVAYRTLFEASSKFVVMAEYYAKQPTSLSYRGHTNKLFKRDFGFEFASINPDAKLIHREFFGKDRGQDDLTVWIFGR